MTPALWWVTLPLLLVGGGWALGDWKRSRLWRSVQRTPWWRAAPGTAYDRFGNAEGQR